MKKLLLLAFGVLFALPAFSAMSIGGEFDYYMVNGFDSDNPVSFQDNWYKGEVDFRTSVGDFSQVRIEVEEDQSWNRGRGTFPEGTYAKIRPIISTNKLSEIKDQISTEDDTVSQKSEIVAFDISFWYKLSDKEVEVQPKENVVKVTFNYEDNKELSKADEIETQEVKVFHIEEVKDEE